MLSPRQLEKILPDEDTVFMDGFSCPRDPEFFTESTEKENEVDKDVVSWSEVIQMMHMVAGALASKTAATERLRHEYNFQKAQLEQEQKAFAKVVLEEQQVEVDSSFLREEIETLLQERLQLQEAMARVGREQRYLVDERELLLQQIEQLPDGGTYPVDVQNHTSLAAAFTARMEFECKLRQELQDSLQARDETIQQLQQQLELLQQNHSSAKQDFKEKEMALLRCLEGLTCAHYTVLRNKAQNYATGLATEAQVANALANQGFASPQAGSGLHVHHGWGEASSASSSDVLETAAPELDGFDSFTMASHFGLLAPRDSASELDVIRMLPKHIDSGKAAADLTVTSNTSPGATACLALTA